ncbi:hypothetical protein M9435_003682 [Picochlorum sp. BPE23]|nr:hypothetical protein M9435_003682 [Picochlorum sp. BPE23]
MSTGIPTKALDTRPPKLKKLRIHFILGLSGVSELYPLSHVSTGGCGRRKFSCGSILFISPGDRIGIVNPSSRVCVGIPMPQQHHGLSTPVRGRHGRLAASRREGGDESEVDGGMLHKTQQELVQIEQQMMMMMNNMNNKNTNSVDDEDAASTTDEEMKENAAFHQDLSNASHAAQQRESSQKQCFVILFGMGSEETEGIYTLRTVEYEEGDVVNVDTVVAFSTEVDAQRFATLLEASLRHHPAVYSTSWVDITEWCDENNARCRLEPSGSLLIPPESNVSVTDWERALALQRGEFSVLEEEPMISQSAMHSMDGVEEAIVDSAFDNHVDNVSNIVDSRLANSSLNSVKEELERILGNSSSSSF